MAHDPPTHAGPRPTLESGPGFPRRILKGRPILRDAIWQESKNETTRPNLEKILPIWKWVPPTALKAAFSHMHMTQLPLACHVDWKSEKQNA